jgi:superfamily II DNA or RNA helicase
MHLFQADIHERCRYEFRAGRTRVIVVLPTGGGKGHIAAWMINNATARTVRGKPGRVLFIAGRREIINQQSLKLLRSGISHGVIMAGHRLWRPHEPVQVASRDTILRRIDAGMDFGDFTLIIADEVHHAASAGYSKVLNHWPDAVVVGLTATPYRLDGKPLGGDLFQSLVVGPSVKWLIDNTFLAPFTGFVYDRPDLSHLKAKARGDYKIDEAAAVMDPVILGGSIIRDYLEHARGKRALCFSVNISHSLAIVQQARDNGIPAEHVDCNTPADEREAILGHDGRLARGETLFVSNVECVTEGTDIPSIEVIILARPTASESLARQMYGRGLRTSPDTGKTLCRIHDHAGVLLHPGWLPDDPQEFDLTHERKESNGRGESPVRVCDACKAVIPLGADACPTCGALAAKGKREIIEDTGRERLTIEQLRERRPKWARELTDQQLRKVHKATRADMAAEYLRLKNVQTSKGFKEGFVWHQFREIFGRGLPRFTDAELADIQPAERPFIPLPRRTE